MNTQINNGAFFTPSDIADEADLILKDHIADDYKDQYVIWDPAAGAGALTFGKDYSNLYSSTIQPVEHAFKQDNDVNPDATHFVYDFLHELDIDNAPNDLQEAFRLNKPILIYMNPPYVSPKAMSGEQNFTPASDLPVRDYMKSINLGKAASQYYAQFITKCIYLQQKYHLTDFRLAIFTPTLFMTGSSYKKFRSYLYNSMRYMYGKGYDATRFNNVRGKFTVLLSIWEPGVTTGYELDLSTRTPIDVNDPPEDYKQWNNDCIVYSLFNTASNQSSLRDIIYKDQTWQIINEFFWLSRSQVKVMASRYDCQIMLDDLDAFTGERFVRNKLLDVTLSPPAQAVLNSATALWRKTIMYRSSLHLTNPELHLNAWDAGFYQVKKIINTLNILKDEYNDFRRLYKDFEDFMRPGVFKYGFLLAPDHNYGGIEFEL